MMIKPNITDHEKEQIEKLREAVKEHLTEYYDTDFNLLRWLIGHDYNFEVIKPKLINHLHMRRFEGWDMDRLADKPRDHVIHKHWMSGLTSAAIKTPNAIVNIEQTGINDYWGLLQSHPTNEILRARVYDLESMLRAVMNMERKTGEQASILYIMDLTGLKMDRQLTSLVTGALSSISAFMSEHYVELIHSFVLVNVPSFIHSLWSLARPLLPERTTKKVKILGSHWKKEILELADASVLPTFWNDEDEQVFGYKLDRGRPFPKELYGKGKLADHTELLTVKPGKTAAIERFIDKKDLLKFEMMSDGHFGIAVYYSYKSSPEQKAKDASSWERIYPVFNKVPGPTTVPMKVEVPCKKPGTYRVWFSNEHAWFHTLKITYTLDVV